MCNPKNHISSGLFLTLVLLPFCSIIFLQVQQWDLKKTAEHRLAHSLQQTISIPLHQLHWEEEGKELLIEGRLFDVATISYKGDHAIVTGIFDDAETRIIERLQNERAKSGPTTSIIQLLLLSQCFAAVISFLAVFDIQKTSLRIYAIFVRQYLSPYLTIISPPPRYFK